MSEEQTPLQSLLHDMNQITTALHKRQSLDGKLQLALLGWVTQLAQQLDNTEMVLKIVEVIDLYNQEVDLLLLDMSIELPS
jgi:hypothetical protein